MYLLAKTIHIIGFVSWFAGLFYLGRMFVYHAEAFDKPQPEKDILSKQLALMEYRVLKIILNPAMIITWICGLTMIYLNGWEWFRVNLWLHWKILFLLLLSGYHGYCSKIVRTLAKGEMPMDSMKFRLFNEVPTVLLIIIAVLAAYKNTTDPKIAIISIVSVVGSLILATKLYKRHRDKNNT